MSRRSRCLRRLARYSISAVAWADRFPSSRRIAAHVTGFDLPPMIERCRTLAADPADGLLDDWLTVRGRQFDLIVCVLVLQHHRAGRLPTYLEDFARMAPAVYLLTRADSDFGTNVLAGGQRDRTLRRQERCVEVEHDPETNQLRALGARAV